MRVAAAALLLVSAAMAFGQSSPTGRVAEDARVVDRVAEASKQDLPVDLLMRIVNEDIELLRGRKTDGTYQYASYERMEVNRITDSFSVDPDKKDSALELRGTFVYRLIISSPSRRMVVTRNKHVFVDHVEIEYIPEKEPGKKTQNVKVEEWIEPGASKSIDFNDIARQATVRVFAHADDAGGYGNLTLTLIQARIFDDPTSPYADAVASEKAILRGLERNDVPSIRAMAQRVANALQPAVAMQVPPVPVRPAASVEVTAPKPAADAETLGELQAIEDLLTGTEGERRQGLDRLHQLVRRLRTARP